MFIYGLNEKNPEVLSKDELYEKLSANYKNGLKIASADNENSSLSKISITNTVLKNKESEFLVQAMISVYENGLVNDLDEESLISLKNSNLILRNISPESSSETFLKSLLKKTLAFTQKYESMIYVSNQIEYKIFTIDYERKTGNYYSLSDNSGINTTDVRSVTEIKKIPKEIVVSIELETDKYDPFKELKKSGLTEKEIITYIFLHELSHTVQHLHENKESLVSSPNTTEKLSYGVVSYAADRQLLGIPRYGENNIYTNMLESYADVRGILMFGVLNPNRFNQMLDSVINWRSTKHMREGHNTVESLILLKEKYPDGLPKELSPQEIHRISRNLATLNVIAKQECFIKSGDMSDSFLIDNNIMYISVKNKGYDKYKHLEKLIEVKEKIIKEENVSEIKYQLANFDKDTGDKIYRDRNGFIIDSEEIMLEKIKFKLASNPDEETVEKINKINNERLLNLYSHNFKLFGKIPPLNKFEEVLECIKNQKTEFKISEKSLYGILNESTVKQINEYLSPNTNNEHKNIDVLLSTIALDLNVNFLELTNSSIFKKAVKSPDEIVDIIYPKDFKESFKNSVMSNVKKLRENYLDDNSTKNENNPFSIKKI